MISATRNPPVDLNEAHFVGKVNPDGLGVSFQYSDGHVLARKVFEFQKDSYLSTVTSEVTQDGAPIPSPDAVARRFWRFRRAQRHPPFSKKFTTIPRIPRWSAKPPKSPRTAP